MLHPHRNMYSPTLSDSKSVCEHRISMPTSYSMLVCITTQHLALWSGSNDRWMRQDKHEKFTSQIELLKSSRSVSFYYLKKFSAYRTIDSNFQTHPRTSLPLTKTQV